MLKPGVQDEPAINYDELETLFQIMESSALRKLTKARVAEIRLIEHRRAHNISIELSGIRKPYNEIRVRICTCHACQESYEHGRSCIDVQDQAFVAV